VSVATLRTAALLLVAGLLAAVSLPLERSYLSNRYAHAMQVDSIDTRAYAYFRTVSGARVAVGGVPETYPYSGVDLANWVDYLGHRQPRGQFAEIDDCPEWLGRLAAGRYDYVVVAASAFDPARPRQADWTLRDPRAQPVLSFRGGVVIRLNGPPSPAACRAVPGSPA
jgi:hypothetical protein